MPCMIIWNTHVLESWFISHILLLIFPDKSNLEEAERTLYALKKLAANKECVTSLLDGLTNYIRLKLPLSDNSECPSVEKAINELLNQILQVMRD